MRSAGRVECCSEWGLSPFWWRFTAWHRAARASAYAHLGDPAVDGDGVFRAGGGDVPARVAGAAGAAAAGGRTGGGGGHALEGYPDHRGAGWQRAAVQMDHCRDPGFGARDGGGKIRHRANGHQENRGVGRRPPDDPRGAAHYRHCPAVYHPGRAGRGDHGRHASSSRSCSRWACARSMSPASSSSPCRWAGHSTW